MEIFETIRDAQSNVAFGTLVVRISLFLCTSFSIAANTLNDGITSFSCLMIISMQTNLKKHALRSTVSVLYTNKVHDIYIRRPRLRG